LARDAFSEEAIPPEAKIVWLADMPAVVDERLPEKSGRSL
jgi:hypothetical protein